MKKNIWIINHYASTAFQLKGGRHFWLSKFLKLSGYEPVVFCANTIHNTDKLISIKNSLYCEKRTECDVPFVFIEAMPYKSTLKRLINMSVFAYRMYRLKAIFSKLYGKPDVIYASSVHPLTLLTGIYIARYFHIRCICEVRDLWPLALEVYGIIKKDTWLSELLYKGEYWLYNKADAVIFTIEGGKKYITDHKWNKGNGGNIDLKKIFYINNGIDLDAVFASRGKNTIIDEDLTSDQFKAIYTGSVRLVNHLEFYVEVAKILKEDKNNNVKILIYGDGDERQALVDRCNELGLDNIKFKGHVDKKYIPYILSNASVTLMQNKDTPIIKYGMSLNKTFDYLASGKPVLCNVKPGFDYITESKAGICIKNATPQDIANALQYFVNLDKNEYLQYCNNAAELAKKFDFKFQTLKLIKIIEKN